MQVNNIIYQFFFNLLRNIIPVFIHSDCELITCCAVKYPRYSREKKEQIKNSDYINTNLRSVL